jgi:hypothetical protein
MMQTSVPGDIIPDAASMVGVGVQMLSHITTLANLSTIPHPLLSVAQILLSRFTRGAVYSDITQKVSREERVPVQSQVDLGIFSVANDRTHGEGIWKVDKASIDNGTLTTYAPQHTIVQQETTEGWSISFSPAAVLGALAFPASALTSTTAVMPIVSVHRGKHNEGSTDNISMELSANELFIRCNDAVYPVPKYAQGWLMPLLPGN